MMSNKVFYSILLGFLVGVINPAYSYDTLVKITGSVKPATCELTSKTIEDIRLGDIYLSSTGFGSAVGITSEKINWSISLKCPSNIPVIMIPKGNSYSGQPNVLALNTDAGSAIGVGVETEYSVENSDWKLLKLNVRNNIIDKVKQESDIDISMRGYYKQIEEKVIAGTANASMTIDIIYQ